MRLDFACGSMKPMVVAPPSDWDGGRLEAQRASVGWGQQAQQLVQAAEDQKTPQTTILRRKRNYRPSIGTAQPKIVDHRSASCGTSFSPLHKSANSALARKMRGGTALAAAAVSIAAAASIAWLIRRRDRRRLAFAEAHVLAASRRRLAFTEAHVLAAMLRRSDISGAALLEIFLERVAWIDGDQRGGINAVVVRDFVRARARAAAADEARQRGELWGPLHGLPVTVSAEMAVAGLPRCSGSWLAENAWRVGACTVESRSCPQQPQGCVPPFHALRVVLRA